MRLQVQLRGRHRFDAGDRLPLQRRESAQIGSGVFLLLFGSVFLAVPVIILAMVFGGAEVEGSRTAAIVLPLVFAAVGIGILAWGIGALRHRFELRIDGGEVAVERRGLRGTRTWRQPLDAYLGVLPSVRHVPGGKNRSSYTEYRVILKHAGSRRYDVDLYYARTGDGHRARAEDYARLLDLPMLAESAGGTFLPRDAADLDKSVKQLVAEGKLKAPSRPPSLPPGHRLQVDHYGDGMVFSTGFRRGAAFTLVFVAAGIGLLYWYFGPGLPRGGQGQAWVVPVVGGVFALVGTLAFVFALYGREELRIAPQGVRHRSRLLGRTLRERRLPADTIEQVAIEKDRHGRYPLTISSDSAQLRFGHGLSREEKEYARDCALAILAR